MLSTRFDEALAFASELHRAQTRKCTDIPYLSHLLSVAGLVLENDGDERQAIAALLHDAIEDQADACGGADWLRDEIRRRFGDDVTAIVEACSDSFGGKKPEWRARKLAYIKGIDTKSDRALLVSLADKVHNARSIVADATKYGPGVFDRFTAKGPGTVWYYRELARAFEARLPSYLAMELGKLAQTMGFLLVPEDSVQAHSAE